MPKTANPFDAIMEKLEAIESRIGSIPAQSTSGKQEAAQALLSRKEAAQFMGISLPTLSAWTASGRLKGYRIGSLVRYKKEELTQSLKRIA